MRKRKLTDSETRLLLLFLSVVMVMGAYFLSFRKNVVLAEEIEAENGENKAYIEMLESMIARRAEVEAQTEGYYQAIEDIIAKYPSYVPTEKAIEIIHEVENRSGAHVSSISFSMDNVVVNLADNAGTEYVEEEYAEDEYLEEDYLSDEYLEEDYLTDEYAGDTGSEIALTGMSSIGYRDTLGISYEARYSDLKKMVAIINGLSDRTTISSITAAYDNATGNISGTVTVNMYYLTNTGKEYDAPNVTGMSKGVPDIFRSGDGTVVPTETGAEMEESEEENEEEQEEDE